MALLLWTQFPRGGTPPVIPDPIETDPPVIGEPVLDPDVALPYFNITHLSLDSERFGPGVRAPIPREMGYDTENSTLIHFTLKEYENVFNSSPAKGSDIYVGSGAPPPDFPYINIGADLALGITQFGPAPDPWTYENNFDWEWINALSGTDVSIFTLMSPRRWITSVTKLTLVPPYSVPTVLKPYPDDEILLVFAADPDPSSGYYETWGGRVAGNPEGLWTFGNGSEPDAALPGKASFAYYTTGNTVQLASPITNLSRGYGFIITLNRDYAKRNLTIPQGYPIQS